MNTQVEERQQSNLPMVIEQPVPLQLPSLPYIEKTVKKAIIGQDEQVNSILTAIYRGYLMPSIKANLLIVGPSGTGKTETIKQIAKTLDVPYTIEDITKYTQEGYVGSSVNEMLIKLLNNANGAIAKAQRGLLVIDEIDKKRASQYTVTRDVSGVEVLNSLLKIIEGTTIPFQTTDGRYFEFNTHNLIVIFMGAFSGIDKIRDIRLGKKEIGFKTTKSQTEAQRKNAERFLKNDLIAFGMPEEFVGRIDTIVEMNKLTEKDLKNILEKSNLSVLKNYENELKNQGIELSYSNLLLRKIAQKSLQIDTGARELNTTVNYIFEKIVHDILANPGVYTRCRLHPRIVYDNSQFTLS